MPCSLATFTVVEMMSADDAQFFWEPVLVTDVVHEAVDWQRENPRSHEIELVVDTDSTSLVVRGDRRDLVIAVFHLIDNALVFSEPSSGIKVEVNGAPRWVDIAVTDHGVGFDSANLNRIFECFFRVEPASAKSGMGLGLPIVRHVARLHSGSASALSILGEGSTFTIRLPRPHESA
jgi:two-component system, OmpR family, sensor histidine kinase SenX3